MSGQRLGTQRIVVIGGGIAGLAVALACKRGEWQVAIVERDPEPPVIAPEAAFEAWSRPGVPQFRHAHILLARLQTLLRDYHPELLAELRAAGLELSNLLDSVPEAQLARFEPQPNDGDLLHLWGRRATFEYVLRRHVERLPHVRFIHSAQVEGLLTQASERELRVHGVVYRHNGRQETLEGDLVVDASGKRTKAREWLAALGVKLASDSRPSGFVYACRHYRLKDPTPVKPRREGGGNLDYLGYATFWAEHGHYAVTFGCPVDDKELAEAMRRPEGFEALCAQFPVLKRWTGESVATSKVLGAGLFENRWTSYRLPGGRELLGFFPVGDSLMETNPMYGRGCSSAFVQAHVLQETIAASEDASERARRYFERTERLLRPYFQFSSDTDRIYHIRARLARGLPVPLGDRIFNHLYEAAWLPGNQESLFVAREFIRAQQMREISSVRVRFMLGMHLLRALFRTWFGRRTPLATPPPPRAEFLRRLGPGHASAPEPPSGEAHEANATGT